MSQSTPIFEGIKAKLSAGGKGSDKLGVFLYNITAADGTLHQWTVDFKNQSVTKGPGASPDVTISASDDDFVAVHTNKISGEEANAAGKIKVEGDLAMAAELRKAREAHHK